MPLNAEFVSVTAAVAIASKVGWRSIGEPENHAQNLGSRGLAGEPLFKPLLQLSVGAPKLGYFVIERRGHVLLRRALLPTG